MARGTPRMTDVICRGRRVAARAETREFLARKLAQREEKTIVFGRLDAIAVSASSIYVGVTIAVNATAQHRVGRRGGSKALGKRGDDISRARMDVRTTRGGRGSTGEKKP